MAAGTESGDGRRGRRWRIAGWTAAAFLQLLPLVAMPFVDEVHWDVADFAIFGGMLVGAGVIYELAVKKTGNAAYRSALGVALAAAFILVWMVGAIGIIDRADWMYGGVLAVGTRSWALTAFLSR